VHRIVDADGTGVAEDWAKPPDYDGLTLEQVAKALERPAGSCGSRSRLTVVIGSFLCIVAKRGAPPPPAEIPCYATVNAVGAH